VTSTSTFTYREGSLADKEQLKHLGIISYGQYKPLLSEENFNVLHRNLSDDSKVEALITGSKCFVCLDGDTIVGMAYLVSSGHPWDIFLADWAYIRMVGVNPAYQGKGIARQLTRQCIDYAQHTGEKTIALHTSEMMDAARHIYESLGFKQLREIEPRFDKRYWLYLLEL
jgi:ribosomal protein S18 acetylase RimI-like enzyme